MIVLSIDTAANLCAACVWQSAIGERGRAVRDVGKGHAEVLMEVIDAAMASAGLAFTDLDAIAVSTGPGSFTGVRIGVATARGLALALKVPAIGVSTLEALAREAMDRFPARDVLAVIDAGRGKVYVAGRAADGTMTHAPAELDFEAAVWLAAASDVVLHGSAAAAIAQTAGRPFDIAGSDRTADIAIYARIAALRTTRQVERPKPLYLRGADAKPQENFALPRKAAP